MFSSQLVTVSLNGRRRGPKVLIDPYFSLPLLRSRGPLLLGDCDDLDDEPRPRYRMAGPCEVARCRGCGCGRARGVQSKIHFTSRLTDTKWHALEVQAVHPTRAALSFSAPLPASWQNEEQRPEEMGRWARGLPVGPHTCRRGRVGGRYNFFSELPLVSRPPFPTAVAILATAQTREVLRSTSNTEYLYFHAKRRIRPVWGGRVL